MELLLEAARMTAPLKGASMPEQPELAWKND